MNDPADGGQSPRLDPGWPPWAGEEPVVASGTDPAAAGRSPGAVAGGRPSVPARNPVEQPRAVAQRPQPQLGHSAASAAPAALSLTGAGVAVVVFAVSMVGMLVNVFTGNGVGWIFGAAFVASCCYTAAQVRLTDLLWAVLLPPLVFAVLVVAHAAYVTSGGALSQVVAGMNGLLDDGPMLWAGTGAAALIAAWRRFGPVSR